MTCPGEVADIGGGRVTHANRLDSIQLGVKPYVTKEGLGDQEIRYPLLRHWGWIVGGTVSKIRVNIESPPLCFLVGVNVIRLKTNLNKRPSFDIFTPI